jgi:hypothetical protein
MSFYDRKNLENWLSCVSHDQFPNGEDYCARYTSIKDWMSNNVYDEVQAAALFAEVAAKKEPIYLNNHSKKHVESVISRATEFIRDSCQIDAYQIYILLVAILIHDAGNIYGRNNHESMCTKIMNGIGNLAGEETAEKRIIVRVAQAHGGYVDDSRDTIGLLEPSVELCGRTIHQRLLAAILRFADELADDSSRASRFILKGKLLGGSEIFHAYSNSLKSVRIVNGTIKLQYELTRELIKNPLRVGGKKKYLIDEIFSRVTKMHMESRYCARYIRPHVTFPLSEKIGVRIDMYEGFEADKMVKEIADPIQFTIEEKGYPEIPKNGIYDLCPRLKGIDGKSLSKRVDSKKWTAIFRR